MGIVTKATYKGSTPMLLGAPLSEVADRAPPRVATTVAGTLPSDRHEDLADFILRQAKKHGISAGIVDVPSFVRKTGSPRRARPPR